ncbi:MAG: DUF1579 family protein [Gemmatimonadota bacterium]|nr:DUF1579 family protein [Gemmatimonadota bacterium]
MRGTPHQRGGRLSRIGYPTGAGRTGARQGRRQRRLPRRRPDGTFCLRGAPGHRIRSLQAPKIMAIPATLAALAGHWHGDNTLWLNPNAEPRRSDATATVTVEAEGQSLSVRYQWADRGAPQSGVLLLVSDAGSNALSAAWTDSWHSNCVLMECRGATTDTAASVHGTYAAPPGADWGWRLALEATAVDECALRMFNISPEGDEQPAVEMRFTRSL